MTAAIPLRGAGPGSFLRRARGEARGFWARGERWVAHAGAIAKVSLDGGEEADRFGSVRARAAEVFEELGEVEARDPKLEGRLRWFGGFSFRDDHCPSGHWEAFPAAHFLLPRLELEGDAEGVGRLRIRRVVDEDRSLGEGQDELEAELDLLVEQLTEGGPAPHPVAVGLAGRETERSAWEAAVDKALDRILRGALSKAVLARTMDVTAAAPLDPVDVVEALWLENRGSHVFLYEPHVGEALVGAAPETLATLRRGVFHATAVAGSTRRGRTREESSELARGLMASEKDRAEQRIVVEDMVARIEALTGELRVQEQPHVLRLPRIQHLETEIRARLEPTRHVLTMVAALHPTPAVCGVPRDAALAFLQDEEPFERGWYAGPVGWFDREGNGVFAPALRCAVTQGSSWRLFAGAGIVAGSQPAAEWEETRIKFEPVLRALSSVSGGEADVVGSSSHTEEEASR